VTLKLNNACVEFPIYNITSRSLKNRLISVSTGGYLHVGHDEVITVRALHDISLSLKPGDRLGLIGHNGAGKTTLLRLMAGVYEPTSGTVETQGNISSLFDITLGIDFEASGYDNIMLRGLLSGLSHHEIKRHREEIAEFSGLGEYLKMPAKTYSSGMLLRLSFSITTSFNPDILLMDEWLSVGDQEFMKQAERRLEQLFEDASIVVFASHAREQIQRLCTTAALLVHGEIVDLGPVDQVLAAQQRLVNVK
jgi:ABC-type polysaccharide/polyol phosphate transport system ATPase subunit